MRGRLLAVRRNLYSEGYQLSLEVKEINSDALQSLTDKELSIELKQYREKRSLNANAYFHSLCGQMAKKMNPPVSLAYMKNTLLHRYGQLELVDGEPMVYKTNAPVAYMMELEDLHTYPVKADGDITFYYVYRGSHTYDSKEFSVLLDGTIEDAKELGIDVITNREKEELIERWGKMYEKRAN